jgi:hypothetical protein
VSTEISTSREIGSRPAKTSANQISPAPKQENTMRINTDAIIPGILAGSVLALGLATAIVVDNAHDESMTRARVIMAENHESYMQLVFDGHLADTLSASMPIEEDDPRWDCATMGNHICGPVDN